MSKQERRVKRMRWTARIIALGVAGFIIIMLVGEGFFKDVPFWTEGMLVVVIFGVALAGGILSWWRERLAGILLILVSIGWGIYLGLYGERAQLQAWLIMGLPFLVAGLLFLNSWRLSRKAA